MHSHDVRALAIWPPHTPLPASHRRQFPLDVAPVLASGGLDMSVVVTPAALPASTVTHVVNPLATSADATFEDAYHRRLAYTSAPYHASALHLARTARLLLCMRDAGVSLWRIHRRRTMFFDADDPDSEPPAVTTRTSEPELAAAFCFWKSVAVRAYPAATALPPTARPSIMTTAPKTVRRRAT